MPLGLNVQARWTVTVLHVPASAAAKLGLNDTQASAVPEAAPLGHRNIAPNL
jgi:hypothetical protein